MDKWIIFDFDGTLADTLSAWVETWNFLAAKHSYKVVGPDDLARLKTLSSLAIKAELGVPWWRIWFLEREGRKKFIERMAGQKLYLKIPETLKMLKQQGFHLAILTSNSSEAVKACLENNNCAEVFDFIDAGNALFKKGRKLKKLLSTHHIPTAQAVYVGDETRDIEAARMAGIKVVSVTWGANEKEVLQKYNPDFLLDTPEQLANIKF